MFRDEGGEVDAGAFAVTEELRGAIGFDDFILAARKNGNIKADDVERAFLESLVNEDDFFWGEWAIADDFDLAAGFTALDAGLVEDVATDDVDTEFFLNIEEFLDNPAIVKSSAFEIEEDVFCALGDARLGEVTTRDELVLAGEPSGWVKVFVSSGLKVFILELEDVLEAGNAIDDLGVLMLSNELVDMERVRLIFGVVKGVTEID